MKHLEFNCYVNKVEPQIFNYYRLLNKLSFDKYTSWTAKIGQILTLEITHTIGHHEINIELSCEEAYSLSMAERMEHGGLINLNKLLNAKVGKTWLLLNSIRNK